MNDAPSKLLRDARGATSAEYIVLFVVIAVGTLLSWLAFGSDLSDTFVETERIAPPPAANSGSRSGSRTAELPQQPGAPSLAGRAWDAAKHAAAVTADTFVGGVVGAVPFASGTVPSAPFGNDRAFGQGMQVTSTVMMGAETVAMVGDAVVTVGSGGTAIVATAAAAGGIAVAAAGSAINWTHGTSLAQGSGIVSSSGGASPPGGSGGTPPGGSGGTPPGGSGGGPRGGGGWSPPAAATEKIPSSWGSGTPNRKGVGQRWQDPNNKGNGVRIDQGNPNNSQPLQQVDHVVVNKNGKVLDPNGKPVPGSIKEHPDAHIPLNDWMKWKTWDSP